VAGVLKIFRRRCRDRCGQFVLRVGNNKRDVPNGQADLHQPARQRPCVRHRPARLPRHRRVSILKGRSHKASIPDGRAAEATGMVVFDPVAYFFRACADTTNATGALVLRCAAKAPPGGRANSFPSVRLKRRAAIPFQDSPRDRGRSRDRPARARQVSDPLKFKPTDSRTNPSSSRHLRAGSDAPDIRRGSSPSSLLPSRGRRSGSHWP